MISSDAATLATPATRDKRSADAGIASATLAPADPRRALGDFLRRMRDRAQPPAGRRMPRRRAVGLRREEVALAAGISVTWYTFLEQGRPVRVSRRTLHALARALGLDATERAHLLRLAEAATSRPAPLTSAAGEPLRALVDALAPHAAYAINGLWDVLHANAPAIATFGAFDARPGITDNVLRRLCLDDAWRRRFADHAAVLDSAVAQFRAATATRTGEPAWVAFVERLTRESPAFAARWSHQTLAPPPAARDKVIVSDAGEARPMRYATLAPDGEASDVRIVLYMERVACRG